MTLVGSGAYSDPVYIGMSYSVCSVFCVSVYSIVRES